MITKYYVDDIGNFIGGFSGSIPEGGTEVDSPPIDGRDRWSGESWVSYSPEVTFTEAKNLIDQAAGNARARFIAEGWEVVEEYRLAQQEVAAWRDSGSPAGDVPLSISTWATAQGMTDEDAAQGIETAAKKFEELLLSIRAIRLAGKGALDQATENFGDIAQPFIDQLNAITP